MNLIIPILFLITNTFDFLFSSNDLCNNTLLINLQSNISQNYIPLHYIILKTLFITNPCNTEKSILIHNKTFYKFDHQQYQWKRLCISQKIFDQQIPIVSSITHLINDLILIINGILFRTQDIISSPENNDIIYRLSRYSNIPILFENIDYVFTTPCCICLKSNTYHSISNAFNDYVILANNIGNVILFYFKSLTVIYDFGNIFQSLSICQSNSCTILYLALSHSEPILTCIIKYQTEKTIIIHQSFLKSNSTYQKLTYLNFTDNNFYITPSTIPNAFFFWNKKTIFYSINQGEILSEIITNGCQLDYLNNHMNESQLNTYYTNLNINYNNLTLIIKDMYCLNQTINYIFISNKEFFILTENNEWLYGKELFLPSIINLNQQKECNLNFKNIFLSNIYFYLKQCLLNINKQLLPCSSFIQSSCLYIRFQPLFNINHIYRLEKNKKIYLKFILESYTIIPVVILSTKSNFLNYDINYKINRLNNGIIHMIGNILVSTTNRTSNDFYGSSLTSFRLDLTQDSYSCDQPSTFSFQIETSCSSASELRIEKNIDYEFWNDTNPIIDIEWIRQNLPINSIHQFSSVYIKLKQTDSIFLKYQYCFNQTCQLIDNNQLDSLLIYAIPINKEHEHNAHYLLNQTDSCIPISPTIYHLWIKWTRNITSRRQLFQIPYEHRTFYRTLLNIFSIKKNSCLFFNPLNSLSINQTINQTSKYILHIILLNNTFSFCELETFLLIEIKPIYNIYNTYNGLNFLITLFIFILVFILFINIYIYYKHKQRIKYLQYHRLNQIDSGQFHQWYDIARYLNENKTTNDYNLIYNYLINMKSKINLTRVL